MAGISVFALFYLITFPWPFLTRTIAYEVLEIVQTGKASKRMVSSRESHSRKMVLSDNNKHVVQETEHSRRLFGSLAAVRDSLGAPRHLR